MLLTPDEFRAIARDFTATAFRFEARQNYNMASDQAEVARFLAGEPRPDEREEHWFQRIREQATAGKRWTKVKVLRPPLTDYQRYSLAWAMPTSVEAGMEYRVIDLEKRTVAIPDIDFWVYDDSKVVVLHYNLDDSPHGAELVGNDSVAHYLEWRDIALKESTAFSDYRS